MRRFLVVLSAILALTPGAARAWDDDGHKMVGAIAQQLLTDHARARVQALLGFELSEAAIWMDCLRAVKKVDETTFTYAPKPQYRQGCIGFEGPVQQPRMEAFAGRNWSNPGCDSDATRGCHEAFHFANIPVQRDDYRATHVGAGPYNIVAALNAALAKLRGAPVAGGFRIEDEREAVLMLAHLLGDVHQPLHMGSAYLDSQGRLIDPGNPPTTESHTRGGNLLSTGGGSLHSDWDSAPFGHMPDEAMLEAARALPRTGGSLESWAASWASETVLYSHLAFQGVRFGNRHDGRWPVTFANHAAYEATQAALQRAQLIRAGARLAEILNATL